MTLPAIRDDIVSTLKDAGLGDAIETHPGRLSLEDLKTFVTRGRSCVRVACLGIQRVEKTCIGVELDVAWGAYILTLDTAGTPRDVAAALLATAVSQQVADNVWGREDLDSPADIRAGNLYAGTLDKRAMAVWAVTWRQKWTPEAVAFSSLDDLLQVVTKYDLDLTSTGEPTLTDTIELQGGTP